MDYDYLFKVVIVGEADVGKTTLLKALTRKQFKRELRTPNITGFSRSSNIGELFFRNHAVEDRDLTTQKQQHILFSGMSKQISDSEIYVQLWDTHSSEKYMALNKAYIRGAIGALLVYDITNPSSLINAKKWLNILRTTSTRKLSVLLIGNKHDSKDRKITVEQGRAFAKEHGLLFSESSVVDKEPDEKVMMEFYTMMYVVSSYEDIDRDMYKHSSEIIRKMSITNAEYPLDRKRRAKKLGCKQM